MSEKFDPYHQWLGIPASEQPPHHYRLLGIPPFEESPAVIENAADRQMAHLRTFQTGKHAAESQRLLNEVAAAKLCLLNPEKKTMYDQLIRPRLFPNSRLAAPLPPPLRQNPQPRSGPAGRCEDDSFDPQLMAIFEKGRSTAASVESAGRGKKSQPNRMVFIGAAALTVMAIAFAVWVTIGHDSTPSGGTIAKAVDPATAAKPPKEVLPKSPEPAKKETPILATTGPREILKSEPEAVAEAEPQPKEDKTAEAKPAPSDPPTARPQADEAAPAKRLAPPSADEQNRLMHEIDEVYKPAEAKVALARKLLEDGRKNEANRAEQFVLLRRAGEIARDAGEADLMLEAVDAIVAAGFDIRPFPVKARLLKQLVAQGAAGGSTQLSTISASCVKFAEEAAASGAVDEASDVLGAAKKALPKAIVQAQAAVRRRRRPGDARRPTKPNGRKNSGTRKGNWTRSNPHSWPWPNAPRASSRPGASTRRFRRPRKNSKPRPTTRMPVWRSAGGIASTRAIGSRA